MNTEQERGLREYGALFGEACAILEAIADVPAHSIGEYMRLGQEAQRHARAFIGKVREHYPQLMPPEEHES